VGRAPPIVEKMTGSVDDGLPALRADTERRRREAEPGVTLSPFARDARALLDDSGALRQLAGIARSPAPPCDVATFATVWSLGA
jgi:hypothetical protein